MKRTGIVTGALLLAACHGGKGDGAKAWTDKPLKPTEARVGSISFTIAIPDGLEKHEERDLQWRHGEIDADGPRVSVFDGSLPPKSLADAIRADSVQMAGATGKEVDGAFVTTDPKRAKVRVHRATGSRDLECWADYVTDRELDDRDAMVAWLEKICLSARAHP